MAQQRLHDWPERLVAYIEERRHMPFAWGSNDCALFAAGAIEVMTGVNLAEGWPAYADERAAAKIIKKKGGMPGLAAACGLADRNPRLAQRGDLVLVEIEGRETYGVVVGNGMWAGPGAEGLVFRPMREVARAFEV